MNRSVAGGLRRRGGGAGGTIVAVLMVLLAGLCPGCAKRSSPHDGAPAGVLRVSQRNEPSDLDPATAQLPDEFFIIRALNEGLLLPDPAGGPPRPGLAGSYEVSSDGLEYTFHLREKLRWSNGDPLTAHDVLASFRRVLEPATAAPKASLFFAVKNARAYATGALVDFGAVGFRAPDERRVIVTLARPGPKFPWYVASGAWIPVNPRVVAAQGRNWTDPRFHVGSGPFTLAEWRPQQRIVVRKNPHYRAAESVAVREIQFLRFDSDETEERAYRAGQVDVTLSVPKTKLEPYTSTHPRELHRLPLAETRFLSFNTLRPPLDDVRVRQALGLAVDRDRLIARVLRGHQQPATRFLAPVLREDRSAIPASARTDPPQARLLLAAAGFPGGRGFPRLELAAWSPSQLPVLEAIQAMWREELGIEVALTVREARVHLAALAARTYDIAFVTSLLDVADAVAALSDFTAGAVDNFPGWRSVHYDELLAAAARQSDPKARWPLLLEGETLLLEAAPVSPLYFNVQNWLMSRRVRGWQQDSLWNRNYAEIELNER